MKTFEGASVNLGMSINGTEGGVSGVTSNGEEYIGVYGSLGTGADLNIDASISFKTYVIWSNY